MFDRLFTEISKTVTPDDIIVLTGDIVHAKTDMTPELVSLVSYFLRGCANLTKTIMIPGNHDLNVANQERMDALTPIVEALDEDAIIYLKDTGAYIINGIQFYHYSVMGDRSLWNDLERTNQPGVDLHVALYHGAVTGATTDIGFDQFSDAVPVSMFDQYDITLLGDIHKTQYLNAKKTIAYPGSLIQQDHSEELQRGMLVWDVKSKQSEFVQIENDYGYVTLNPDDGVPEWLPPKARVRVVHNKDDKREIKSFLDKLKTDFAIRELRIEGTKKEKDHSEIAVDDIINSRHEEVQMKLIREYLTDKTIDADTWLRMEQINHDLNGKVRAPEATGTGTMWKPISFKFSNMFSYGEDNVMDFTKMEGIIGMFAPNASGKSTLLDAIVYCVFDKCSRTNRAIHVMNNRSDWFRCEFTFMIGDKTYRIMRHGTKQSSGDVSVAVDFHEISGDEGQSLNGKRRDETNKIIRDYIGTYDDFILTTMSTQTDNRSFIDMTKKDRQELLYRFLDVYVFIDLFNAAKDASKDMAAVIKVMELENYTEQIERAQSAVDFHMADGKKIEQLMTECDARIKQYTQQIEDQLSQRLPIDASLDIDALQRALKLANDAIINATSVMQIETDRRIKLIADYEANNKEEEQYYVYHSLEQIGKDIARFKKREQDYELLMRDKAHLESKVDALKTHEYDPNCKYCVQNKFVIDAKEAAIKLEEVNAKIVDIGHVVNNAAQLKTYVEADQAMRKIDGLRTILKNKIIECESTMQKHLSTRTLATERRDGIEEKINRCIAQEDDIKKNRAIDSYIETLKITRQVDQDKFSDLTKQHNAAIVGLTQQEAIIKNATEKLAMYNDRVLQYRAYDLYMGAVNRDGVPYMILKRILPIIESEVNEVLLGIVDFTFGLSIGEGDTIDGIISYGEDQWAIELISGMERFILSLAIRSSLIRLSGLPKPNFLVIDEGFGVLDADKLNSIHLLFSFLKQHFEFVLCISHITEMRDYVDSIISIDKTGEFSVLRAG